VLLVDRTGGGKSQSHVIQCAGIITRGIVLVIVPLLALAADVIQKFENLHVKDDARTVSPMEQVIRHQSLPTQIEIR
jgi:superfamily II DNA helicase RecQ